MALSPLTSATQRVRPRASSASGAKISAQEAAAATARAQAAGSNIVIPPGATGGGSSGVSALPFYFGEAFPAFQPIGFSPVSFPEIDFPTIKEAPYQFVDPQQYAKQFGDFNVGQIKGNFQTGKEFAFEALNAELQGLKNFAPAAAALKRQQTSLDNQFNQAQRTQQVRGALPGVEQDLSNQRDRANTYASGRLPDSFQDRQFELGIRSRGADQAGFSGIGVGSSQARKTSDLMSAEQRLGVAQFGEQLLGNNIQTRANLFLAPTEYADAGSQIRVTPEIGAGRLTYEGTGMLNEASLISPSTALSADIQQRQFKTQLTQRTNEYNSQGRFGASQFNAQGEFAASQFNAQNRLAVAQFNSTAGFSAALGKFNYDVGYLSELQGANQANLNTALGVGTAGVNAQIYNRGIQSGQAANEISSIGQTIGAVSGALQGVSSLLSGNSLSGTQIGGAAAVGGSNISGAAPVQSAPAQAQSAASPAPSAPSVGSVAPVALDSGLPSGVKFAQGVPAPSGYVATASNPDGTYSAVPVSAYQADLERFAKFGSVPSSSFKVESVAAADQGISNAASLSYVPTPGFQPIATTSSGRTVYSEPSAAANGDYLLGQDSLTNVAAALAQLGISDEAVYDTLGSWREVSNPEFLNSLDNLFQEQGEEAVGKSILNKLVGGNPNPETPAGQQLIAGAGRLGQLWGGLSPAQKSMGLSSLAGAAVENKTGKALPERVVPGTEKTIGGPLKVGDVINVTNQGANGFSLARNWGQVSAIGKIIGVDPKNPGQLGQIAENIGILGYGAQGGAVPIRAEELKQAGATAAPEFGVGAISLNSGATVPKNYGVVMKVPDGGIIALPKNLMNTTPFDTINPLAFNKARQVATNKHPAQRQWKGIKDNHVIRGSAGGSALVSGLMLMKQTNPTVLGSIVAYSFLNSTLGGYGDED